MRQSRAYLGHHYRSQNYTIDDSEWSTPSITLSEGWNMLRIDGSNEYIDQDQVDEIAPILHEFWNQSLSWTEVQGGWLELSFIGTDIWTYGISGPDYSTIEFTIDDEVLGSWSQTQEELDYHHLMFELHNLEDVEHKLRMVNLGGQGQSDRMAFDYAIVQSESFFQDTNMQSDTEPSPTISEWTEPSSIQPQVAIESLTNTKALAAQITSSPSIVIPSSIIPQTSSSISQEEISLNSSTAIQDQSQLAAAAAASSAALAALLPTQYSLAQLSSLKEVYKFHWNAAAYFVVVFSSTVVGVLILSAIHLWLKSCLKGRRQFDNMDDFNEDGSGYRSKVDRSAVNESRNPTALNGKIIGNPMNAKKNGEVNF